MLSTRPKTACALVIAIGACLVWGYLEFLTPTKLTVSKRLNETEKKSEEAIDLRLKPMVDLFAKAKKGSGAFSERVLSLEGKWAFVKGIAIKDSHRKYMEQVFSEEVLSSEDLRKAMESVVQAYLDDIEGFEAEMLVKLRADLADPQRPVETLPASLRDNDAFRQEFKRMSGQVVSQLHLEMGVFIGQQVGGQILANIPAQIAGQAARAAAINMGVGTGLLGSSGVGIAVTIGVGLYAIRIIDKIIEEILHFLGIDPSAKIEKLVCESIDKLQDALLRDTGTFSFTDNGALRKQLEGIHKARTKLRREAINRLLKEGGM